MACIQKKKLLDGTVSYRIQVKAKNQRTGKFEAKAITWRKPLDLTENQAKKELNRIALDLEEKFNKQLNGLRLVYLQKEFSDESYQSLLNDSIIETIDDENLRTFLSALLNYEIHNYQHAENNLYYLIDNNIYYTYAAINISSIQKDKAELILANQNYNDPVSINTKKTTEKRKINKPIKPDYQQALNTLTELSNNNKTNPFIWYNLGNIHLQMQEFHKAIDDYSLAIKYEKNLAEAYYNRGLTLLFLGEKDLANSDLSKAGELGIKEAYAVIKRFIND